MSRVIPPAETFVRVVNGASSLGEAAQKLGVSKNSIRLRADRMRKRFGVKIKGFGGARRYTRDEVEALRRAGEETFPGGQP
jgi:transposase